MKTQKTLKTSYDLWRKQAVLGETVPKIPEHPMKKQNGKVVLRKKEMRDSV